MMKRLLPLLLLVASCTGVPQRDLTLHYDRPATFFEEALPVGNGRLVLLTDWITAPNWLVFDSSAGTLQAGQ